MNAPGNLVPLDAIEGRIHLIRGQRVMLSTDLAELYGVPPKVLVQSVNRNIERFPHDFMFQLTIQEVRNLKSQIVTSSWGGLRRAMPYAFTEQGVAMLSSVLRSDQAIAVNIEIMRAFVSLKRELSASGALSRRLDELEVRSDRNFKSIFDAIRLLLNPPALKRRKIGFEVSGGKRGSSESDA
jgi:hypothetical protein